MRFAGHFYAWLGLILCCIYGGAWFKVNPEQKNIWMLGVYSLAFGAYLVACSSKKKTP